MRQLPDDYLIEYVLQLLADGKCSARWALKELGFYYDPDLYYEFVRLQHHEDVNDPALRKALDRCMKEAAKGVFEPQGHPTAEEAYDRLQEKKKKCQ